VGRQARRDAPRPVPRAELAAELRQHAEGLPRRGEDGGNEACRGGAQRVRPRWPEAGGARLDARELDRRERLLQGVATDRGFAPRDDESCRRHAEHRQQQLARRTVRLHRHDRRDGGGERLGRRSQQPPPIDPQIGGRRRKQLCLQRAGEDERRAPEVRRDAPQQRQPLVAAPFAACADTVGDDADVAAGDAREVVSALEPRVPPSDRTRLLEIERLAGRSGPGRIDEQQPPHAIGAGERVRGRAADLTRADNRDGRHE
jgi:hypothetical protein